MHVFKCVIDLIDVSEDTGIIKNPLSGFMPLLKNPYPIGACDAQIYFLLTDSPIGGMFLVFEQS